ncbi:MAG: hypothetical protein IJC30_03275 [Alphaproteobacteria bacterium]|nr:hypothetical protein [Alphaproteobacteria bacterium]
MKKLHLFRGILWIVCLMSLTHVAKAAVTSGCNITDPAVLIQQIKSRENSVSAARLLREIDFIIKELHAVINIETAPEIEDTTQQGNSGFFSGWGNKKEPKPRKKRNRDIELEMTIIPIEELQEWAKPLLTKKLKDKMEEYEVVDSDGNIQYNDEDIVEKARTFTREVLIPIKITNEETLLQASNVSAQNERREMIQNAYISAAADAYAIGLLAQYRLADFDEVILTPFRQDLEASEDLMDRFRKNTWAILGLMSQINMSNIRSASNLSLLATGTLATIQDSERVRRYQAKKE